jgi:hypothetical protein
MVIGTPYASLEGKTFRIKDASCYFEYYDSRVSYFFTLTDPENNEVVLYFTYNQPLEQMIHIKGYIKKFEEANYNQSFSIVDGFQIKRGTEPVKLSYQLSPDNLEKQIPLYNRKWTAGKYKYVSTPERYIQMLYLELISDNNEVIYVDVYEVPDQK